MSTNAELATIFERMAAMLELLGEDRFRVNAHARAARAIEGLSGDVAEIAENEKALTSIDGIGAKTAKKIREYVETGRVHEHDELLAKVPAGLLEVLDVPGLGPKTVRMMWMEKGVESIADLKRILDDGSILELPRMGEKTVQNIRESLAFAAKSSERIRLGDALPIAERLVARLEKVKGVQRVAYAGSLRRGRETIGDLDILVSAKDGAAAREAFTGMEGVEKVLASGEKKSSVRLQAGKISVQADLRVVDDAAFGAALMYFTGSKEHNVRLRERAIRMGMTLNEYGLFPETEGEKPPQEQGVKPVASRTEEEIYEALGMAFVPAELREDQGEVSDGWETPELVEVSDVRAELHAHTTASDGVMSIVELAQCAKARGFHTIAVTDHSKSSVIAGGLDEARLRKHIEQVREANGRVKGITILAGSEVDIHADGSLDYDDELLAELDVVVASPHAALRQETKEATKRLLRAVAHPLVHVLGHPTGRIINRREGLQPDMNAIAAAAAEHGTALEINCNHLRLDLRDRDVRIALEHGALLALNCDVHAEEDFDELRYGVLTGRRGGLTPERCINTWGAKKLHGWLKKKRGG
ncbi:MAG: DNA polymerase/3'-5' exonuclease PolX [Phycisphaeraceae bacterium]|nr:MAG: DNA polymerase/3'-5' exonuclease PolX [Phycisphaeraceae bacterium]